MVVRELSQFISWASASGDFMVNSIPRLAPPGIGLYTFEVTTGLVIFVMDCAIREEDKFGLFTSSS
jgi:hypothetical protein